MTICIRIGNASSACTGYSVNEKNYVGSVKEKRANYDLLTTIMICLGNPEEGSNVLKLLDVLLSSDIEPKQKKDILEHEFDIPMTETFERKVEVMCNLSKGVEEKGFEKAELQSIKSIMENLKMTAEQAMEVLNIALDKRARYGSLLNK